MVAGSPYEGKTYIYRDPIDKIKADGSKLPAPTAVLRLDAPQFLSFSANARFIAVQSAGIFSVYDAENARSLRYDTKLLTPAYKATWMDGHRLMVSKDGKMVVFDFDGTNMQTLSGLDALHVPAFDKDYKAVFTVTPSATATKTTILRTELKVSQ
jgi:hypothetical protein